MYCIPGVFHRTVVVVVGWSSAVLWWEGGATAPWRRGARRWSTAAAAAAAAAGPLLSLLALLAALPSSTSADVVFRVPEVMVRHTAAPRAVGTGPSNASSPGGGGAGGAAGAGTGASRDLLRVTYEEYFVEHDIPTAQARKAAKELDLNDEESRERRLSGCGTCSRRELEYCESRVLADHCCCERRYLREPFPWLPHTCYVGPRRCRPLARNCEHYTRLRDCCCYDKLAARWKGILSGGARLQAAVSLILSLVLAVLLRV